MDIVTATGTPFVGVSIAVVIQAVATDLFCSRVHLGTGIVAIIKHAHTVPILVLAGAGSHVGHTLVSLANALVKCRTIPLPGAHSPTPKAFIASLLHAYRTVCARNPLARLADTVLRHIR